MKLSDALRARSGVVCVVGAGGKKSTLYALARRLDRAVVTATVRIPIFDQHVDDVVVTERPVAALERATDWPVGVVPDRDRDDRYRGYDPGVVDAIGESDATDAVLVKADGARMREFKAPGDREPRLPTTADTVLPIASVHAVGEPLTEACVHRPERVAALTGLDLGDTIRPSDVATVLTSERGGLADVPDGATVVPVLNKVDDSALEAVAREIASEVLARSDVPRVALTRLTASEPVVAVVGR
ncbi:selenium cofactor biosynthesis protein YqeC [Haloferax sulfurifontis]|uniref:Selenium-dependent hydroxylase accessory protein YqeC n=1 Tax=Haloferax sulfurifontis TaxID=255616 RepID=A0A830DZZ8_9EURY|nr:selenium cofactor biosynthesis protein YqeC [Haloferax sulfurifontis]GGC64113.1 hypothetical protein GCM10007209_27730 [Haloferax sulfurifontis]